MVDTIAVSKIDSNYIERLEKLRPIVGNVYLAIYLVAAEELGIKYELIKKGLAKIYTKNGFTFIEAAYNPLNHQVSSLLAGSKRKTQVVLSNAGVSVPSQEVYSEETKADALGSFQRNPNIVVKPIRNYGGKGVTVLPKDEEHFIKAFDYALTENHSDKVILEQFVEGDDYRILVLNGKILGAMKRHKPHIFGNGVDTIEEIIRTQNIVRKSKGLALIAVDATTLETLADKNYNLQSIPTDNEMVLLRKTCNMSLGGSTEEYLSKIHPKFLKMAVDASIALGLEFAGVDIISKDITDENAATFINEVNSAPGLRMHYIPDIGDAFHLAKPIMEVIYNHLPAKLQD